LADGYTIYTDSIFTTIAPDWFYSNGVDTFTLERDYSNEIKITHVVEHGLDEGHSWDEKNCVFKNNNIYLTFAYTKYKVNSDVLIITENDKSTKYKLIDIK
jgi:hypothetical protein